MHAYFVGPGFGPIGHCTPDRIADSQVVQRLFDAGADDIDDASVSSCFHARQYRLGEQMIANQMLLEGVHERFHFGVDDGPTCRPACIVYQDVHRLSVDHGLNGGFDLFGAAEVGLSGSVSFRLGQRAPRFFEPLGIAR